MIAFLVLLCFLIRAHIDKLLYNMRGGKHKYEYKQYKRQHNQHKPIKRRKSHVKRNNTSQP